MLFLFHKMAECEFHSVYVAVRAKGASLRVGALVGLVVTYAPSSQDAPGSTTSLDVHCTLCCECDDCCCCCCCSSSSSQHSGERGMANDPAIDCAWNPTKTQPMRKMDRWMDCLALSLSVCVCASRRRCHIILCVYL